jgi:hypothetical protein
MPFRERSLDEYSNFWFGSTFAPNQWMFNNIVTKENIDKLEEEGGICILYTHLGYYMQNGVIDAGFIKMVEYIGAKKNGWFVPVCNVLDFLNQRKIEENIAEYIPYNIKKKVELHSLITRIKYRYVIKTDDYHFKKSNEYER